MTAGHTVGYIRVSSVDQNRTRQLDGIKIDKAFTDKDMKRPQLERALEFLPGGRHASGPLDGQVG